MADAIEAEIAEVAEVTDAIDAIDMADTMGDALVLLPVGARATIHGLQAQPKFNGLEAVVHEYVADKGRFSARVTATGDWLLLKPQCLERCESPFAALPDECITTILSLLSWVGAARAASVQRKWRNWSRFHFPWEQGEAPAHWRDVRRFGSDWAERRAFLRPPRWIEFDSAFASGSAPFPMLPSWTWALLPLVERRDRETHGHDLPLCVALMCMLLHWLDEMEQTWPGVAATRWPGVARRLAWCLGAEAPPLLLHEARGQVAREFPRGSGEYMMNEYRGGGRMEGANEPVGPCQFELPPEVALFFALLPEGVGEQNYSDGMGAYAGFEVGVEPWTAEESWRCRASNTANLRRQRKRDLGADSKRMLSVAHWVTSDPDPHSVEQSTIYVCCDTTSAKYGQLLLVETFTGDEGTGRSGVNGSIAWCDPELTLVGLLDFIREEATRPTPPDATSAPGTQKESWDGVWAETPLRAPVVLDRLVPQED